MSEVTYSITFDLVGTEENEAFAAISLNPALTWTKFVLTDNQPNANKQRIAESEFSNLIKTGIYMPIKMAVGEIADGHQDALPIGVISHLKQVNNTIQGLAALWDKERPEDVKYIKERYANKQPLQLSWEILYGKSSKDEDGIEDLVDTALRAVTLVGMPAYSGRTPIIAVASTDEAQSKLEENKLEELEQLKGELETAKANLTSKDEELIAVKAELEILKQYKASIEKEQADLQKLVAIRTKFVEAGIEKSDEYFAEKKALLLGLDTDALDFMIQEMVSFASASAKPKDATSSTEIPPLNSKTKSTTDEDILRFMRERLHK